MLLLIITTGCDNGIITGKVIYDDKIKIGYIGPLSGNTANFGLAQRNAILLGIEKVNNENGINGKKIEVVFEDTKHQPGDTVTAVHKLINLDNVISIVGPTGSSNVIAISNIVNEKEIPIISPIATGPDVRNAGKFVFRTMPSVELQTKELAAFVYNQKIKKVGVLYINNEFGKGTLDSFTKYFKEQGGEIIIQEAHDYYAKDYKTSIIKLQNANIDAIFLATYAANAGLIVKQIKEQKIDKTIFGVETLGQKDFLDFTGNLSNGIIYAMPKKMTTKEFAEAYITKYDKEPIFGSDTAYDGFMLIVEAARMCGTDGESIRKCLHFIGQNYSGVSGTITFDTNGDVNKPFDIFRVENGKGVLIGS